MTYAAWLAKYGGMACAGGHLGVMVADSKDVDACPPAWCFVPLEDATEEIVQEAIDWTRSGRKTWPDKVGLDQSASRPTGG